MLGFLKGNKSNTENMKHHFHFNVSPRLLTQALSLCPSYNKNYFKIRYIAKTTQESFIYLFIIYL